ncbi:hypothetical protein [Woeseia oceani]|uniref:Uncharacterized protein n=1 Tax=Woeseia oceani TaxID=1548547 RepID=A0A193LCT2_9GAMM|nr:hypothetical protein [Woeseia oceani]ANO50312.1 hypothetical protein BA177_02950 [Woeseia oceani]
MQTTRSYDTVAFDVRDDAMMLFFARTSEQGEIDDYLLLMRCENDDLPHSLYIEINEQQFSGHDLVREARMSDNMLTLLLNEPAAELNGEQQIVLTYEGTAANKASVEAGAFRVLGECLAGGNA